MTDCWESLFEVAVELPKCTNDLECLGLSADCLFENLPGVSVVRYLHLFRTYTQFFTLTEDKIIQHKIDQFPDPDSAAGALTYSQDDIYIEDVTSCEIADLVDLRNSFGAVCFMGVPLIAKDRFVGALMVGSTAQGALSPPWVKEVLDFIACLVAPYLHLKNVRRDLQLGKTILHEVAPDQVVSRMLEPRTGPGFIPVRQTRNGVRYASDDSDVDPDDIVPQPEDGPQRSDATRAAQAQAPAPSARREGSAAMVSGSEESDSMSSATVVSSDAEGFDGRKVQHRRRRRRWPPAGDSSSPDVRMTRPRRSDLGQVSDEQARLPGGFGGMGLQPRRSRDSDWSEEHAPFSHLQTGPFNELGGFEIPLPPEIASGRVRALQEERPSTGSSHRSTWASAGPDPIRPAWKAVDFERSGLPDPSQEPAPYKGYYAGPSIPSYTYPPGPSSPRAESEAASPTRLDSPERSDGWRSGGPGVLIDAAGRRYRCRGEVRQRILCRLDPENAPHRGEASEATTSNGGQQELRGGTRGGQGGGAQLRSGFSDATSGPGSSSTWWEDVGIRLGGSRDSRASDRTALGATDSLRSSGHKPGGGSSGADVGIGPSGSYGSDSGAGQSSSRTGDASAPSGRSWFGWRPWTAVLPSSRRVADSGGSPGFMQGGPGVGSRHGGTVRAARAQGAGSGYVAAGFSEIEPLEEEPVVYDRNGTRYRPGPGVHVGTAATAGTRRAPRVVSQLTSPFESIMPLLEPAPEEVQARASRYSSPWG